MFWVARVLYGLALPVGCVLVGPFWLLKMIRRGGWGSGLLERVGIYDRDAESEKQGGVYVHAVSVGEVLLAIRMIEVWGKMTGDHFVLVPTTATGMAVAREKAPEGVRVIYAPVDFGWLVRRVMGRFAPRVVVLMESELWPNLIVETTGMGIPVGVANARLSERSGRRLKKFGGLVRPMIGRLSRIGVPEEGEVERWVGVGAREDAVVVTGNVKFDPLGGGGGARRVEFEEMLGAFGAMDGGRKVVMAVSTFAGEEEWLAGVFLKLGEGVLPVVVPRHAERRDEVARAVEEGTGRRVVLRSKFEKPLGDEVFVIDSTGELRDWTGYADVVVVGKSFRARGGQSPAEAIQAGVPVICGREMGNFEPLVTELREAGGIWMVESEEELLAALKEALADGGKRAGIAEGVLGRHEGAVGRTVAMF